MSWDIPVEDAIEAELRDHPLTLRVIQDRGGSPLLRKKDGWVMQVDPAAPRCGYLEDDLLCGVHKNLGVTSKPLICRLYPMILTQTPEGVFVGAAFSCTAVRQNSGRPLQAHQPDIEALVEAGAQLNRVGNDGLLVHANWFTDWSAYCRFERQWLQGQPASLGISSACLALARTCAGLPRSRSGTPQAWPDQAWPGQSEPVPAMPDLETPLRLMWDAIHPHLKPDLLGVEPSLRPRYRRALERMAGQDWSGLYKQMTRPLRASLEAEIESYLQHLIFRKQLVMHPTLLANLILLSYVPGFLRIWSINLAEGEESVRDDLHWALDLCEKFLVYHSHSLRATYQKVARQWVQEL